MNISYETSFVNNDRIKMNKDDFVEFIIDYNLPLFIDEEGTRYTIYETKWIFRD